MNYAVERLPDTRRRIERHTPRALRAAIARRTRHNIERYAHADGTALSERIAELDREWDVERWIAAEAPLTILAGIALAGTVDRRWLLLPGFAAVMLVVHGLTGWYPLLPLLRRAGVRTTAEIAAERHALQRLRGDFHALDRDATPDARARQALTAAESV